MLHERQRTLYDVEDMGVFTVQYAPSGVGILAVGGEINSPGQIAMWRIGCATCSDRASANATSITTIGWEDSGQRFAIAGQITDEVEVWDRATFLRLGSWKFLRPPFKKNAVGLFTTATHVDAMKFDYSGTRLFLGCWDTTLKRIDLQSNELASVVQPGRGDVSFVHVYSNGTRVLTAHDHSLFIWDADDLVLRERVSLDKRCAWWHWGVDLQERVISTSTDGRLQVWDLHGRDPQQYQIKYNPRSTLAVAFGMLDSILAFGQSNGKIVFWSTANGERIGEIRATDESILGMAFAPDRKAICITTTSPGLRLVEVEYSL